MNTVADEVIEIAKRIILVDIGIDATRKAYGKIVPFINSLTIPKKKSSSMSGVSPSITALQGSFPDRQRSLLQHSIDSGI